METITYDEHVERLRRLRDDEAVRDDYQEFRAAAWFFELDRTVSNDHIQAVWDRQPIEVAIIDEEAEEAAKLADEFGFLDLKAERDDGRSPRAREWLYPKVLLPAQYHNITAPTATGKSGLGLDLCFQIVLGRTQLEMDFEDTLVEDVRVLYIDRENPLETIERRFQLMPYPSRDQVWKRLFYRRNPPLPMLDTVEGGQALLRMAEECGVDVVFIDTKSKFVEGPSEKDYTEHRFYNHTVNPLKDAGIAVVVLDHTNLTDLTRPSGSGAKKDNVDVMWVITKAREQPTKDKNLTDLVMTEQKERGLGLPKTIYIRRHSDPYHHDLSLDNPRRTGLTDHTLTTIADPRALLAERFPNGVGQNKGREFLRAAGVTGRNEALNAVIAAHNEDCKRSQT